MMNRACSTVRFASAVFALGALAVATPLRQKSASAQTLHYIPHTHWEGAVFFTREEYLEIGLPHILTALHQLERYPEYQFTLDQVAYFKPFLERYPEAAAAFRRYVAEGRLHIVGGMDVMPDDVKPGGEAFIRQMQYGKGFCRRELGVDVTVAWMLDTFGHHPQMPQLLSLAGYTSFWFCRGVPNDDLPSEFSWRGIDGTKLPSFWVPGFYGLFYGPPRDQAGFTKFFEDRFSALDKHVHDPERVGLAGVDVCEPEEDLAPLVRQFNGRANAPFSIRFSGPEEFAKLVAKRSDVPTLDYDFNPIFQGTYSSRIEIHQAERAIEHELLTAETLAAFEKRGASDETDARLWRAWEPLLFDQTHDLASGVMTDPVYEDTLASYATSRRLAAEIVDAEWNRISGRIDTSGEGIPIVVFDPLGSPRTDVVEVELGELAAHFDVVDANGASVPWQLESRDVCADGSLRRAKIAFLAENVPALGYSTYRVVPKAASAAHESAEIEGDALENEFFQVKVDRVSGALTSVIDKSSGREVLAAPGNVVVRSVDNGDAWEPYHTLDGGMYIAVSAKQPSADPATAISSASGGGKPGSIVRGDAFSEFQVEHAFGSGTFATRVRLAKGVPRIDIETELVNREKHVRYQVLFPTAIRDGHQVQEIPFGAVERPLGVEYPAQNWIDYRDDARGVALLNVGMPGNLVLDQALVLSLLRAVNLNDYNEGRSSDSGFELGVKRTFRYALVPHAGDWRRAELTRRGLEFNSPLIVRKTTAHAGDLQKRMGFAELSNPDVVLTTFKNGADHSTIVRVYDSSGRGASAVALTLHDKIVEAREANLLEEAGRALAVDGRTVKFDLRPFQILTLRLVLASGS